MRKFETQSYFEKKEDPKRRPCLDNDFDPLVHDYDSETGKVKPLEDLEFWAKCLRAKIIEVIEQNPTSTWAFRKKGFLEGLEAHVAKRRKEELGMDEEGVKAKNLAWLKKRSAEEIETTPIRKVQPAKLRCKEKEVPPESEFSVTSEEKEEIWKYH